jgi:nucleotide-binding universal stress UspA family protein
MNILFSYDGSASADDAIETAATILGGEAAQGVVLTVWEPLIVQALRAERFGSPVPPVPFDAGAEDTMMQQHARQIAEHGARLAGEAGLEVRPLWISDDHDIARAIVEGAAELDADLIVMGARGLTGIRALIGSISRRVVADARRPVLVIPAAEARQAAAAARRRPRARPISLA